MATFDIPPGGSLVLGNSIEYSTEAMAGSAPGSALAHVTPSTNVEYFNNSSVDLVRDIVSNFSGTLSLSGVNVPLNTGRAAIVGVAEITTNGSVPLSLGPITSSDMLLAGQTLAEGGPLIIMEAEADVLPGKIPTVSEWGLIVLTVLLLTAGTIVFGRQRRLAAA